MRDLWNPTPQHRGSCKIQGIPEFVYTSTPWSEESQQEDPGEEKKGSGYFDTNKVSAVWKENVEKSLEELLSALRKIKITIQLVKQTADVFPGFFGVIWNILRAKEMSESRESGSSSR